MNELLMISVFLDIYFSFLVICFCYRYNHVSGSELWFLLVLKYWFLSRKTFFSFLLTYSRNVLLRNCIRVYMYTRFLDWRTCMHAISDVNPKISSLDMYKYMIKNWLFKMSFFFKFKYNLYFDVFFIFFTNIFWTVLECCIYVIFNCASERG